MILAIRLPGRTALKNGQQNKRLRHAVEGVSLWLSVMLMLFVHPLYAEASLSGSADVENAGILRFVDDAGRWQEPALVLDSEFDIRVSGLIADSRLSRSFRNTGDQWREGVFVFPLPDDASVYGLTMKVGERTIVGKVRPKPEARKIYETAKKEGRHAANVEQQRPNLFTARVANIPPGETVTVDLQFQQPVQYRAGEFELRLPTTLTPRYMPGTPVAGTSSQWEGGWSVPTTQVPDASAISPFTVLPGDVDANSHRARIQMKIDAGLPLARVFSPSHRLESRQDGQAVMVTPEGGDVLMNRDFVVRWRPLAGQEPTAAVFHQRWKDEDYLMTMLVPGTGPVRSVPRELVFVIDTSGSMAGESIRQAQAALERGLDTLKRDDRFNIIRFSSQAHAMFMQPVPATGTNLARARRYVAGLNADGGTEMASALSLAMEQSEPFEETAGARVRQLVFITDGAVGNEAALFRQIRTGLKNQRLFTVGIGSAPNMHFMREAARWGRGTYTAIQDPSDVRGPLDTLFSAMESPVLTNIDVQWPGQTGQAESFPRRPGDLFAGDPLIQVVRGSAPAGELKISALKADGSTWQKTLDLQQAAEGVGIGRQWAREKIDSLLDAGNLTGGEVDKALVTELAVAHGLMSPYTSFVAVDETPVRGQTDPLSTEQLPTLLPKGSTSGMLRYPQTATYGPLMTALGLTGLMFAAAIVLLQRREVA
ncbi:Inter-alpha-trypsin inhibitor domain protein [Marinobacter nitratireducens]|uniref:Inter-alpha-trypsin inhibitor domain protein n=1 Tax=Marinobacter nitratireducens TaxID=1137280 RepID=A0A072N1T9_9GAMM|nr:marine proteobacterial sortase target protein [Marinobacter nitratireducens]KEF30933.1 Inter-alpha-trypsin inhibitor domain protein [Marinobacter nitratireducens]